MAKVGIITFLHNDNYGSSLQAYALQRAVREMGHECAHLDYRPDRGEKIRNLIASGNSPKLILEGMRKKSVKAGQQGAREKSAAIPAFYARRMKLTAGCRNLAELSERSGAFDTLICGSDQIWNPVWLNEAYFLTFAGAGTRKIAYAPSLGVRTMPAESKQRKIRKWTEGFAAISVREAEGADLMEKITGKRPAVMPDPVCLMRREDWEEIAGEAPAGEPYILCYFIGENGKYREKAREIQKETGMRILEIPVTAEGYASRFEKLEGLGPEEFLGAIRGAGCFCTDSFHGLVFGTLMGVRTEAMRRYREDDPESKNSRVDHFLRTAREKGLDAMREEGLGWLREQIGN